MTNGDKIRNMTDEELAFILMCPYDTAGDPIDIMPCVTAERTQEFVSPKECMECMAAWLKKEAK